MKKDKKLFVIGTSHVADCHYDNLPKERCNVGYPNFNNGELTWPEYLGKKLNREVDNCGINSYGIDTYFCRILNIVRNNNKDIEFLIEIPSAGRYELYLNNAYYIRNSIYDEKDFWSNGASSISDSMKNDHEIESYNKLVKNVLDEKIMKNIRKTRFPYIWAYSRGDILRVSDNKFQHRDDHQLSFLKKVAIKFSNSLFPTVKQFDALVRIIMASSNRIEKDTILTKCLIINGYLKSLNIPVTWFSTTMHPDYYETEDSLSKYPLYEELNLIDNNPLFRHYISPNFKFRNNGLYWESLKKNKEEDPNKYYERFPDTCHLYMKGWRELVDKLFIPYYNKKV